MTKFSNLKAMREQRAAAAAEEPVEPPMPAKVGRPRGKRSDPAYQQVTVLLHGDTYREARKRLLDERKEVSTLLNELLDAWLKD